MKITLYKLLGLVQKGKAPKYIKYDDNVYELNGKNYYNRTYKYWLTDRIYSLRCLDYEVEIIKEYKKAETLHKLDLHIPYNHPEWDYIHGFMQAINKIIDYLQRGGEQ